MTTNSSIDITNAPRDPKQLATLGRFQLRRLAEAIGMLPTDEQRKAFMSCSNDAMAQHLSEQFKIFDANGGVVQQQQAQQQMQQAQMQAGSPVQQQTQPKRQPRTSADTTPTGVVPSVPPGASDVDVGTALLEGLRAVAGQVTQVSKQLEATSKDVGSTETYAAKAAKQAEALLVQLEKLNPYIDRLSTAVEGSVHLQSAGIALNLILAEQVLQAPSDEVLKMAFGDAQRVKDLVMAMHAKGKAG